MDQFEEGTYKSLIMQRARETHTIRAVTIELLDYCNFRCNHCYIRDAYQSFIDVSRVKDLLVKLHDLGCIWLLLTGGEILLHPHFLEIYEYAYNLNYKITLFTNGYLLNDETIAALQEKTPDLIEITMYGGDARSFDSFVEVEGAFSVVDANISKLIQANIPLKLKFVAMKHKENDLAAIRDYALSKKLGLRWDTFLIPSVNGNNHPLMNRISEEKAVSLDWNDQFYIRKLANSDLSANSDALYTCDAGYNSVFVDAKLNLSICEMARNISVSIADSSMDIREAQEELICIREAKRPLGEKDACYRCKYRKICRYCPGQFLLANGNEYKPINWNCNYAALFYERLKSL